MIPKFRAWDKLNKEMLKVDCINWYLGEIVCYPEDTFVFSMKLENIELMQSTGLKDKNGKEIFEGDIVKPLGFASWKGIVRYCNKTGAFILDDHDNDFIRDENVYLSQFTDSFEILGNIYENTELLGVE